MAHQSQATSILGALDYDVTSETYGSEASLKSLSRNQLVLPPLMWSACDLANFHFQGIPNAEPLEFAKGLLSEAQAFQNLWPRNRGTYKSTLTSWVNSDLNLLLSQASIPEWVAVTNLFTALEDLSDTETIRQINARWWGLVSPYREEYEAIGKANKSDISTFFDRFSGFGRGLQFYPTLVESLMAGRTDTLGVVSIYDATKTGTINAAYDFQGNRCNNTFQAPYNVDVTWNDGTTEQVSYLSVRQLDPVLNKPMECRAQWTLSPMDGIGVPRSNNDFVRKLGAIIVIAGLGMRDRTGQPLNNRVKAWTRMAGAYLQDAAKSETYENMTGSLGNGWESPLGQDIMVEIAEYLYEKPLELQAIGAKIAAFLDKEEVFPLGSVTDSGLVLCPHCKKCETIADANWKDFGIQCFADADNMISYTWRLQQNRFNAVGRLSCSGCGKDYYRRFNPLYRTFSSQLPINSVPRKLSPLTLIDNSRQGGSCAEGSVTAYTILMPTNKGSSGADGLPAVRVFAQVGDLFRANDIPLEVGSQSRNLKRVKFCSGKSIVSSFRMASHSYYDAFLGSKQGDDAGVNKSAFSTGPLGNRECAWCKSVSQTTGEDVPTTLIEGGYYTGNSNFMQISRLGDGSKTFDRRDKDYDATVYEVDDGMGGAVEKEIINYYKIRLVAGNTIRFLHIEPDELGIAIPEANSVTAETLSLTSDPPCPNEASQVLEPAAKLYEQYYQAKVKHENLKAQVTVCEQLAYSACINPETNQWHPAECPAYLQESRQMSFGDSLFNINGERIDLTDWAEGNKSCWTPTGSVQRFPDPAFNLKSASLVITPYADNRRRTTLRQYHILKQVGGDAQEVILPTGEVCQEVTPYLHCVQCEKSYHGAPNEEEGKKWGLPMAVGNDYLRPETSERRNDSGGGYSSATKWHYTLPLYSWVEGESLEAAIKKDPATWKQMFPQDLIDWLLAGKVFTSAPVTTPSEDKEVIQDA